MPLSDLFPSLQAYPAWVPPLWLHGLQPAMRLSIYSISISIVDLSIYGLQCLFHSPITVSGSVWTSEKEKSGWAICIADQHHQRLHACPWCHDGDFFCQKHTQVKYFTGKIRDGVDSVHDFLWPKVEATVMRFFAREISNCETKLNASEDEEVSCLTADWRLWEATW